MISSKTSRRIRTVHYTLVVLTMFLLPSIPMLGQNVILENDITYGNADNLSLRLDLARPTVGSGPFPALMFLCGNSWGGDVGIDRHQCSSAIQHMAAKGYVAASVDVRYIDVKQNGKSKYVFPDQLYDAKCAVRWLKANSNKYNIDPARIGVVGFSSGGHLALLLALTRPTDGLEGACGDLKYSSSVRAVVSSAGPPDLIREYEFDKQNFCEDTLEDFLGGSPEEVPLQYQKASPINYVYKDAPPILIMQGDQDHENLPEWSKALDTKLEQAEATHSLIIMKGHFHEDFWDEKAVWDFLAKYLNGVN